MELAEALARDGGVIASRAIGDGPACSRAIRRHGLTRIRRGWYAAAGADPDVVAAVRAGGALTCVSRLAALGAWRPPGDSLLHVRFADAPAGAGGIVAHVRPGDRMPVRRAVDDPATAMTCLARCCARPLAVAVADSVLRLRILEPAELAAALRVAGESGKRVARWVDPTAESGIESLLRVILLRVRVGFRAQVVLRGVGRVDFLVGDRLVVEADGLAHHTGLAVQRDRDRDNACERLGFHRLRFTYWDIIERPELVEATIRAAIAKGEHRWRSRNRLWAEEGANPVVVTSDPLAEAWSVCRESLLRVPQVNDSSIFLSRSPTAVLGRRGEPAA